MIREDIPTVVCGVIETFERRDGLTVAEIVSDGEQFAWELHDLLEQLGFAPKVRNADFQYFWVECNGRKYYADAPNGIPCV